MTWIARLIPSRAALAAALAALAAALFAWARRDARQDTLSQLKEKDQDNAKEIRDRVSDSRADPERLRPFDGAGWRD
tara:strand:- start:27 stop:257 length:231 start_codon:yes stop_codon:yes gene_type:complete